MGTQAYPLRPHFRSGIFLRSHSLPEELANRIILSYDALLGPTKLQFPILEKIYDDRDLHRDNHAGSLNLADRRLGCAVMRQCHHPTQT